jgi:hypothetical protein
LGTFLFIVLENIALMFELILEPVLKPFWGLFGARIWLRWSNMPARRASRDPKFRTSSLTKNLKNILIS